MDPWWKIQLHVNMVKPFYEDKAAPYGVSLRPGLKTAAKWLVEEILDERFLTAFWRGPCEFCLKWQVDEADEGRASSDSQFVNQ